MAISEDRRIQRTRKALIDSLRELILECVKAAMAPHST